MKFTLFALLAAFCVLSVNAGTWQPLSGVPEIDMEFQPSDFAAVDGEVAFDPEVFGIFSTVWWSIKAALRSVKGLNCIIKWVVGIQDSALQYNADIVQCGVDATSDVTNLINANLKIINTASNIINLKSTICASTEDAEQQSITNSCAVKTLAQVFSLYKQVKSAIKLAKKIPQTGPNAVSCISDATNTLTSYYTQFPSNMKTCSKLTSK
ncbi:PREDICTED: uncharacterized protein LOC108619051 isoform X2 [Drosophila arizonae]|uniref:Uncharacterized protein LOC108619051 isoform X1 n=1 Tax=Drosophila arizonae TaxID=7263 RepID=A0ABM1PUF0_DROAR|nr:PREDICTED: uncharacterized protein LOC108619051 isoform X1 [Drosophila arizonae]XP_017870836.1 PREDICTED: uncharacterized protein LOC108619051 isoform X2 [Drosophila arizonae]